MKSPVGSMLVSRTIATGPCARRSPMFSAAAWPSRALVHVTSTLSPPVPAPCSSASSAVACSVRDRQQRPRPRFPPGRARQARRWLVPRPPASRSPRGRRRQPDWGLVEPGRHMSAGPVADTTTLGQIRRRGGRESEVGPAIDDLPAGRLDLVAEAIRLGPVLRGTRRRPRVGCVQDLVRDPSTGWRDVAQVSNRPVSAVRVVGSSTGILLSGDGTRAGTRRAAASADRRHAPIPIHTTSHERQRRKAPGDRGADRVADEVRGHRDGERATHDRGVRPALANREQGHVERPVQRTEERLGQNDQHEPHERIDRGRAAGRTCRRDRQQDGDGRRDEGERDHQHRPFAVAGVEPPERDPRHDARHSRDRKCEPDRGLPEPELRQDEQRNADRPDPAREVHERDGDGEPAQGRVSPDVDEAGPGVTEEGATARRSFPRIVDPEERDRGEQQQAADDEEGDRPADEGHETRGDGRSEDGREDVAVRIRPR